MDGMTSDESITKCVAQNVSHKMCRTKCVAQNSDYGEKGSCNFLEE